MTKQKETLVILWLTFLTVVAWVSFSIYHIWVTSTISEIDAQAITPIDPKFNTATIDKLKSREVIEPLYQFNEKVKENTATPSAEAIITTQQDIIPQESIRP